MKVPYVDFPAQYRDEGEKIRQIVDRVFSSGVFVGGPEVEGFEKEFGAYCGAHAVAVANGTDAIALALRAYGVGPGDEVITAPNSFFASAGAIAQAGATPVFADVRDDLNIDPEAVAAAVTPRTKAILPVHLAGLCCDMDALRAVAARHKLLVIEDAAQAAGATYKGRKAGALGDAACFSFHPLKNLNAAGDAGAITTTDERVAERLRRLRNHGMKTRDLIEEWGVNSRLDAIQAALLRHRLENLHKVIRKRRENAALYRSLLPGMETPRDSAFGEHTHHLFVLQTDHRDDLRRELAIRGIESAIHYPTPIHRQEKPKGLNLPEGRFPVAERQAKRILSLPVHQYLTEEQITTAARAIAEILSARR